MSNHFGAIESLLDNVGRLDKMTNVQVAAFRAQLTRLERVVTDPEMKAILADIREQAGEPESPGYTKQTADDLVKEYEGKWLSKSGKQRAAFKAKVSKMFNSATQDGDTANAAKLKALQDRIEAEATKARLDRIRAKAKQMKAK